jgi:AcrR family transcriptional regulator/DNA-binding MarR family transcriptional regulator
MPAPARGGAQTATRLRDGERALPVERRVQRRPARLVLPRGTARARVEEVQRSRLLAAAAVTFDEVGYELASAQRITVRARVSRRTFYELFDNREACLVSLLEEAAGRLEGELVAAGLGGLAWCERVRRGLWVILSFLDAEPVLARVCVVRALCGGPRVMEWRERILVRLAGVLDEGRGEAACGAQCSLVTAEGLVGGAFGVVYARLRGGDMRPLRGLLDELMGMIVLQYLGSRAARRERRRRAPEPVVLGTSGVGWEVSTRGGRDPLDGVDMRLTYRTARVLAAIAELGGRGLSPSNREVAERAGVADPGQISKLLRRLERLGLVVNVGGGHRNGEPNAWQLTPLGRRVSQRLSVIALDPAEAAASHLFTHSQGSAA